MHHPQVLLPRAASRQKISRNKSNPSTRKIKAKHRHLKGLQTMVPRKVQLPASPRSRSPQFLGGPQPNTGYKYAFLTGAPCGLASNPPRAFETMCDPGLTNRWKETTDPT